MTNDADWVAGQSPIFNAWRLIIHGHEGTCLVDQDGLCTIARRVPRHRQLMRKGFRGGRPKY